MNFADISEYSPPSGNANWMANLMYFAVFVAAIVHIVRSLRADPSLSDQIEALKEFVAKYFTSRTRHDALDQRVSGMHSDNLGRFDALAKALNELRAEVRDGNERIADAGNERMEKLGEKMDGIAMDLTNKVGELRGEVRRMNH